MCESGTGPSPDRNGAGHGALLPEPPLVREKDPTVESPFELNGGLWLRRVVPPGSTIRPAVARSGSEREITHRGGPPDADSGIVHLHQPRWLHEGPNGELDWPNVDPEFNDFAARQLDEAGTIGFGRATYEHMAAYWPTEQAMVNDPAITLRMNDKEKLVFSTSLTDADWSGTTVVRGGAIEHLEALKAGRARKCS